MSKTCKRCQSEEIIPVESYDVFDPDTDEYSAEDGFLCKNCGCFHSADGLYYIYEASEPSLERNCFK